MQRSTRPLLIMGILWIFLIGGLGLGFLWNRQDLRRRNQHGQALVARFDDGVPLAQWRTHAEALSASERAARANPADPSVWSIWALVQSQGVLLQGSDPGPWNRIHRVASQLLGREWAFSDARTRLRLLTSRILVRCATAETQTELMENFFEALRVWDLWPRSSLLRNATLWAGVAAGQVAFVRNLLPGPELPLDWPLLLDWHLSRDQLDEAEGILDLWTRTEPGHATLPLWRDWIACRRGQRPAQPEPAAGDVPPAQKAWNHLVRACAAGEDRARAVDELQKVPLVPQDAVLLAVMRLAQEFDAQELYSQVRKEFSQRRSPVDERLESLDATDRMNRLEPEPAFAWFSQRKSAPGDATAVWSAILSGELATARRWATGTPKATWPPIVFSETFTGKDLDELDRLSRQGLHRRWWSALWTKAAVSSLDHLEWGTTSHEARLSALRERLATLPEDSRFTARLAARVDFDLERFAEAGGALARLCGDETLRFEDDLGPCKALRGPEADLELYARFLTCEEVRPVDYPRVRERLERILPLLAPAGRPSPRGLFWQLRFLRVTLRALPGQGTLVEEKLKALSIPPQLTDPEILLEAALIHLYLGKAEAAAGLLSRLPSLPVREARRLAHHYLVLQDPTRAVAVLQPVLARGDLAPRVRQTLRVLQAEARLQLKQDVCAEFEDLFRLDPCPEMAVTTAQAYLGRGRREDCPRLRELISPFTAKSPELARTTAEIAKFCADPDR
ncbi:MAG: hypothetical protein CVU65_05055 [Deltaproteobacteria bacterium HGW-Deltaproteobacteria-22]|nr:MAG: hypothetical protein CVU65_05055 [Deltaproteobacteria bacterium HGW-Deltaproteobacteria-22]